VNATVTESRESVHIRQKLLAKIKLRHFMDHAVYYIRRVCTATRGNNARQSKYIVSQNVAVIGLYACGGIRGGLDLRWTANRKTVSSRKTNKLDRELFCKLFSLNVMSAGAVQRRGGVSFYPPPCGLSAPGEL